MPASYTTLIKAAPPVATAKSQRCMSSRVFSWLGCLMHKARSSGAPTFLSALRMCSTVSAELPGVRGCGDTIMALRVFNSDKPMQQTVLSGLVHGTTLATTP